MSVKLAKRPHGPASVVQRCFHMLLLCLAACPLVWGNKFGIGIYCDTPGSPNVSLQLASARNLTGANGWVTLFFDSLDPLLQPAPLPWQVAALEESYALGLSPLVRLGQPARNYRNLSDDAAHMQYHSLASAYARYVAALPLPPSSAGGPLHIIVGNEWNICGEWVCSDGEGVFLKSAVAAQESAAFTRDVLAALRPLPRLALSAAPIAVKGHTECECTAGGAAGPQSENGTLFISSMLAAIPDLFTLTDAFAAHPYPWCPGPFANTCASGWLATYRQHWALALPSWRLNPSHAGPGAQYPIFISETGWAGSNETGKAEWIAAAFEELFLPDGNVTAVTPFLLAGQFWARDGWPWTLWDAQGDNLLHLQPQYLAIQALAAKEKFHGVTER